MNRHIVVDCFHGEFIHVVINHLKSINLPEKAGLLLDNCPGHPPDEELVNDDQQIYANVFATKHNCSRQAYEPE